MKLQYKSQTDFKISLKSKIILSYINKCIVILAIYDRKNYIFI